MPLYRQLAYAVGTRNILVAAKARAELILTQEPGPSSRFPTQVRFPKLSPILNCFPGHKQGAGREVGPPGQKSVPKWDLVSCKARIFSHQVTMPVQMIDFYKDKL